MSTREPPRGRDEDDWLAGEGGVDWGFESEDDAEPERPPRERTRTGLVPQGRAPVRPAPETYQRRRLIVGGVVAGAILIAIIVAVVASSGGGGSPVAVPTTPLVTQPVTPVPETPTTSATTTTSQSSLKVTVPADAGNISAGDSGDPVLTLQKALKELGYDVGTPDGKFGQATQDAVKAFQTDHGLDPDGIVGQGTADAINSALSSGSG